MNVPGDLRYSKEHEWLRIDGDTATLGITDYAQDALGDIVFVELPDVGSVFEAGEAIGVVESVKAASDVYTPVGGEVIEINEHLVDAPETANAEPYGVGWMVKIRMSNPDEIGELMDAAAYQTYLEEIKE